MSNRMNITRANREFRKLASEEKLLWDEIRPLLEDVVPDERDRNAFLRLKTMLERVRNTDIYVNYWSMAAIGLEQQKLSKSLFLNDSEQDNEEPQIEKSFAEDEDDEVIFLENEQDSQDDEQTPNETALVVQQEKREKTPAELKPALFPPAEPNKKDVQLVSEFINKTGSDEVPYLITILENGKNPRFCLNVDGSVRSCRQDYASPNSLEIIVNCTKGKGKRRCYARHRLKVKTREMITKVPILRYGKSEHELDIDRPDLIYDRNNYTVLPNYHAKHTCYPIAFRTVKMIKQGQSDIKSLAYESGKSMAAERKYRISEMVKSEIIDPQGPSPTTVTYVDNVNAVENSELPECPNSNESLPDIVSNETMTINEVTVSEVEDMQT